MSFRKITVKSGDEEFTMEVTEEEYRNYFRPWWQQKKYEQRNREAMEQNGYMEESYEVWRDNASEGVGIPDMELPGVDELVEKKLLAWYSPSPLTMPFMTPFMCVSMGWYNAESFSKSNPSFRGVVAYFCFGGIASGK